MDKYVSNRELSITMPKIKFYVYKDKNRKKRTTITLDNYVCHLLALKLGSVPASKESRAAVRQWIQAQLDEDVDPDRVYTSQWLQGKAVLEIADKELSEKYWGLAD
jgi:hypothetical protein